MVQMHSRSDPYCKQQNPCNALETMTSLQVLAAAVGAAAAAAAAALSGTFSRMLVPRLIANLARC